MKFPDTAKEPRPSNPTDRWGSAARLDGVSFVTIGKDHYCADSKKRLPAGRRLESTRGSPIDRIPFSYENIQPVFEQMRAAGLTIVEPVATRPGVGLKSFFVPGPDNVQSRWSRPGRSRLACGSSRPRGAC